jgi:asparagine synthase (glutamine-hydrolysing)
MHGVKAGDSQLLNETFHEGVFALNAGTWIKADHSGLRRYRYWELTSIPGLVPKREDDAFESLRGLLVDAVENRISGIRSPGALLSGGLDSSSLVAIAARSTASRGESIRAIAGVLPEGHDRDLTDEREFIDEFRDWPGVKVTYVSPLPEVGPFTGIDNPEKFARTFVITSRHYLNDALHSAALSLNVELMLDGIGGEFGPTAHNRIYFLELLVSGKWDTLWRELKALNLREGVSPLRELAAHLMNVVFPLRRANPPLLLNPNFIRTYAVPFSPERPWPDHRRTHLSRCRQFLDRRASNIGARRPVPHSYPMLDRRVLEFSASAPGPMKVQNGYTRVLIRRSLDGILPSRIQWRVGKTPFSPDYFRRFNRQINQAGNWLAQIKSNDPVCDIVDIAAIRERLRPFQSGDSEAEAHLSVPLTMYLVNFLRQFPQFCR